MFGIICRVLRLLPHCVTVAQLTLDQFVKVRILVRQPLKKKSVERVSAGFFCFSGRHTNHDRKSLGYFAF